VRAHARLRGPAQQARRRRPVFARSQDGRDARPCPLSHQREGPMGSSPSFRSPSPLSRSKKKKRGNRVTLLARERFPLHPVTSCARSHRASSARQPHTRYLAPHSARARDLTMAAQEHAPGAYHPDTTNRLWNSILASPIRITPLLIALALAKVASRPSMPSDCHRTVRLDMGEHGV
jgi:hypothetical protein